MSKRQLLCVLGVWVMIFLFLGLPSSWHEIIAVVTGLIIVAVSYTLPAPIKPENQFKDTFVENKQP
jgi:hypothetical protein